MELEKLIQAFNDLHIPDMDPVTQLNQLKGDFINLTYRLPGGQETKLWDDDRIYYGAQLCKHDNSGRCYGLVTDGRWLLVCEYGDAGSDPEIVLFKRL